MGSNALALRIIGLVWIAWSILWLALAFGAKPVARREPRLAQLVHLVPSFLAGWLMVGPMPFLPWLNAPLAPCAAWMAPAGSVLVLAGLLFAVWARFGLGRNWSGLVTVQQSHALVRTGAYALVRHPIYTGLLLAVIGTALAIDARRGAVAVLLVFAAVWGRMRREEAFMLETFGPDYVAYRAHTAALVPFIW